MTMVSAHSFADEIQIGSGTTTQSYLPSWTAWDYTLSQQIYTGTEISEAGGDAGTITSIAFYNGGSSDKTRTFDIYLVNTTKSSFSSQSDWITVTESDLVFSGSVTLNRGAWNTISFTNSFAYDGGNICVVVNDKTGTNNSGLQCRSFTPSGDQGTLSIMVRKDGGSAYDPYTISGNANSTYTYKNQIQLEIESAAVTCAKPKNFNAESITAHEATLTWQAGAEGQTDWDIYVTTTANEVPDENTTPTYQVTECSKALSNLTAQTTYYTYVRANCGSGDKSKWANKTFTTTREALTVDATHPYNQDFESNCDWGFTNGTLTNQWCYGSATNNGGSKAMYISNDNGTSNAYTVNSTTTVFASKLLNFAQGTYTFVFDWKANGESGYSEYDYLRAALVPDDVEFTAGTSLPSGVTASALPSTWIAIDGGHQLNQSSDWQTQTAEADVSGTYTMVFIWRNDSGGGNQPPAAIDNISISLLTCPRPTALAASNIAGRSATLSWTENGTATNWVLQYATNNSFSENLVETNVSGTPSKDLTNLSPETTYYARVKSILGSDESSWSDVKNFTTLATCPKPTASYVSYSATAYTGTIQWTGSTADAFEVAYRPTSDFDPSDYTLENVTRVQLENITEYTYTLENLSPETKYYIYIQANCGAEDGLSSWSNRTTFTTLETCLPPTGLSTSTTSSTITLNWTAGAEGQDAWDIRYKKSTDSDYTYIHLDNHPTTNYTITGLNPVTTYGVNVRAYCSETDQSKWGASTANQSYDLSVTTECAALTLPYTYGFEENLQTTSPYSSSNPFPKCWDRIAFQSGYSGSYTYYPYVFTATYSQPYAHGGNGANSTSGHSMRFYQTSSSTNECAVLPEISSEYNMNSLQIRFWAAVQSSQGTLSIGIMESPTNASTFTSIQEVTVSNTYSNGFQEFTVPFSSYTGNGRYIAFMCGTGSSYAYFLIDDITVEVVPTCFVPTNLEATVNSATETVLTWTAGLNETDWELEVIADGNSISQIVLVSGEPTYTLTTTRATAYTARVRANCGDGDYSDWSNPIIFTSDCGTLIVDATHPFLEDFENIGASDFPPICWSKFWHEMTGNTNVYWYLNSNNGLGSSAAYSYWNQGYAFLVLPQMHIDGEAELVFDYLISSGSYNESCSVVVSTNGMTYNDFTQTIWAADANNLPTGKANATVSLSDFDNQDIYIAFKFKGAGTNGCTWYVDNVQVYVPITQTNELVQGWNWWSPTVEVSLEGLETALGSNGITIKSQTESVIYEDEEWLGDNFTLIPGQMYKIKVSADCEFILTGKALSSTTITIEPGYNWFGYTSTQVIAIENVLEGFEPEEGDVIKSLDDSSTFEDGEWIGDITHLQPGHGYVYISHSTGNKTVTLP